MGSLTSRIIFSSSVLDEADRDRVLAIPAFNAVEQLKGNDHRIDLHLLRLGIISLIKSTGKVRLTPAGRVIRRLLQEIRNDPAR